MGAKILVVDDQRGVRKLLEELFRRDGYEVSLAADGLESVDMVKNFMPDVVLMDMKMPNMNGLEASREIFKIKPDLPIIMMTAYGEMEVVHKALEIGVKKYITKPFDVMELRRLVKEILNGEESKLMK